MIKGKLNGGVAVIYILFSILLIGTIVAVSYFLTNRDSEVANSVEEKIGSITNIKDSLPSPTPFPFQELTIPFLRNYEFDSELTELDELSSNANYDSYLTSYDSEGFNINGLLTIPNGEMPENGWPAIVFVHGYIPPTLYETTENYEAYVDYFARNGFVVFKIDLRGHNDSEGVPFGAYYASDYIMDTLNAYSALQKADFVNADAVGLWGHSMGGNVTFRSFVAKQDIPAIVIWAGAVYTYDDMRKYSIDDNSYRPPVDNTERQKYREELNNTYGQFDANSEFWKKVVPTNFLNGVTGAVQIHHAVDDDVVNIGYSRDLMRILDSTTIPHQLQEYAIGGHNISGSSFNQAMQSSVQFFKQYLQSR